VHLVTRDHFRSRDKDGSHTIRFVIAEKPMLHSPTHKPHGSIFYRTRVMGDQSFTLWA